MYRIETEIDRFPSIIAALRRSGYNIQEPAPFSAVILPQRRMPAMGKKPVALCLLGLIHGNEVAGAAVINALLSFILQGRYELQIPIAVALGNPHAAKENRRFIDADLNRSFGRSANAEAFAVEHQRARQLEPLLQSAHYLIDFHQTTLASPHPFFIFPYTKRSLGFANAVAAQIPVVTHWGEGFSKDGRCSDEFTNSQDGCGITLELGQNGFGIYQIAAGFQAALAALETISDVFLQQRRLELHSSSNAPQLYTWSKVIPFLPGQSRLVEGLHNFGVIAKDELIGYQGEEEIRSDGDGFVLFPFYPQPRDYRKPSELCRLLRPIGLSELPK